MNGMLNDMEATIMYYEINENAARIAHNMNSMHEYRTGQTTEGYRREVDRAAQLAADQTECKPDYADELAALLDRYARKLADWYNKNSSIEAVCPSVMISGASNFPVRKKEKQNARREAHNREYQEIQGLLDRMKSIGTGGIQSDDENAIEKLTNKLEDMEEAQATMKAVNAYYRKHKTLDGCPGITEDQAAHIKAGMASSWRKDPVPFEAYSLTNNNANIRRVKERIAGLSKIKAQATSERETQIDGVKVVENTEIMRIQIVFDGKPEPEVREILKGYGFRWTPSQEAWQRQLTPNGKYAAKMVIEKLRDMNT